MEQEKEKKKVQLIAQSYYSRKDIQKAIFEFCKNRETVPRYLKGFGKRPDMFDYPSDILNSAKKGATSFHCSEEIWENPLDIDTDMTSEQYNQIRKGWDFLIDIDSPYLDYSKIAAKLIIKALEYNGVKNIGVKFSGSKGFHILVPWKAFPKQVGENKTSDFFPEWARLIAQYIDDLVHDQLTQEILDLSGKEQDLYEIIHKPTGEQAVTKTISKYICPNCRAENENMSGSKRKKLRCALCNYDMDKVSEEEIYATSNNTDNSKKNPQNFEKKQTAKSVIDSVDIVLVASRHLFRAPYSLHEKTSLASIVINKEDLENFQPIHADPLKAIPRDFNPNSGEEEAKQLLLNALDWAEREEKIEKKYTGKSIDLKGLTITENMFPDIIKKLLKGIKDDGRKRALSLLLAFYSSLEFPEDYIKEKIEEWNKKNYKPLKEGYIRSQIAWNIKHKRMPQNYDKPIYKEFGFAVNTQGVKNPINYTIGQALKSQKKKNAKQQTSKRN